MDFSLIQRLGGKSAVRAGNDVFPANQLGETNDPLSDKLGVFDDITGMGDDAGAKDPAFRELYRLEHVILVFVSGVGRLEAERTGVYIQHKLDHVLERRLEQSRPLVDAITSVETYFLGGNSLQRRIDGLDVHRCPFLHSGRI